MLVSMKWDGSLFNKKISLTNVKIPQKEQSFILFMNELVHASTYSVHIYSQKLKLFFFIPIIFYLRKYLYNL